MNHHPVTIFLKLQLVASCNVLCICRECWNPLPQTKYDACYMLQLTDQKIAMEMTLGELGVSAKTNLLKVQSLFDAIDKDKSGDIDGDELTCAQP